MNSPTTRSITFWETVRLLLGATRKRSAGRQRRQQKLLNQRTGKHSTDWGGLGFAFAVLFMAVLNVLAAFVVQSAFKSGERLQTDAGSDGRRNTCVQA
jgi:hypothetical protein